jgi:hypothetical protein
MQITANSLLTTWAVERMKLRPNSVAYLPLDLMIFGKRLCALVASESCSILIPVSDADVFSETREATLWFLRTRVDCGEGLHDYLQLSCFEDSLEQVFSNLCSDLIEEVFDKSNPGIASRIYFDKWRVLFAKSRDTALSKNALVGLFGELAVLKKLVSEDETRAINCWVGPDGAPQDFTSSCSRIEVKSTTTLNELVVSVSGVHQLESHEAETLHLVVNRVTLEGPGVTLPELVKEIIELGVDRISLYEKLGNIGYDWSDPGLYHNDRFALLDSFWFCVDEAFPKIVSQSFVDGVIPAGVENVKYSINLGSGHGALNDAEVENVIEVFLRGEA